LPPRSPTASSTTRRSLSWRGQAIGRRIRAYFFITDKNRGKAAFNTGLIRTGTPCLGSGRFLFADFGWFLCRWLHSAAIERKERETPPREIQFGGEFEAHLLALACSDAPEGKNRWTVRLLAEKMVELKIVQSVSPMTVCNTLKKMNLSLTKANTGRSRRIKTPVL
jgi:hypothetical protein